MYWMLTILRYIFGWCRIGQLCFKECCDITPASQTTGGDTNNAHSPDEVAIKMPQITNMIELIALSTNIYCI